MDTQIRHCTSSECRNYHSGAKGLGECDYEVSPRLGEHTQPLVVLEGEICFYKLLQAPKKPEISLAETTRNSMSIYNFMQAITKSQPLYYNGF